MLSLYTSNDTWWKQLWRFHSKMSEIATLSLRAPQPTMTNRKVKHVRTTFDYNIQLVSLASRFTWLLAGSNPEEVANIFNKADKHSIRGKLRQTDPVGTLERLQIVEAVIISYTSGQLPFSCGGQNYQSLARWRSWILFVSQTQLWRSYTAPPTQRYHHGLHEMS